jgi:hypothetical protein
VAETTLLERRENPDKAKKNLLLMGSSPSRRHHGTILTYGKDLGQDEVVSRSSATT